MSSLDEFDMVGCTQRKEIHCLWTCSFLTLEEIAGRPHGFGEPFSYRDRLLVVTPKPCLFSNLNLLLLPLKEQSWGRAHGLTSLVLQSVFFVAVCGFCSPHPEVGGEWVEGEIGVGDGTVVKKLSCS